MSSDRITTLLELDGDELLRSEPNLRDFFGSLGLDLPREGESATDYFASLDPDLLEDLGIERSELGERFAAFVWLMDGLKNARINQGVESVTIRGGTTRTATRKRLS